MTTKIAVIGMGFVGGTIYESIKLNIGQNIDLVAIDTAKGWMASYNDIHNYDAVFVCVPSPQGPDGTADTSILENVLAKLTQVNFNGVIISKVTAPPNVYQRLQEQYINLVHAPEFLTAANAFEDYINGKFAIIGGAVSAYRHEAERIIRMSQKNLETVKFCSIGDAALAKYAINSFLATKVIFMNELYQLATKAGLNYDVVSNLIKQDARIGDSHMRVPGPDGSFGFGGMCFPKDTSALLKYAETVEKDLSVLDTAVKTNLILRLTEPK
jgi:UDPglucose 6-dehydrogenase